MKLNYRLYILPLLVLGTLVLEHTGLLHISYLYIKSHELKWTNLDYTYYYKQGDVFTAGESVSNNNYEDALLAFSPDYDELLDQDLKEIAANRPHIDSIDGINLSFYSGSYLVKACLDQKDISINDSTLFKKIVDVEIIGDYELYDSDGNELLFQREGQKFWIRDKIIFRGLSRRKFIENKINEIWLAQISNNAHQIINYFENPFIFRVRLNTLNAMQVLLGNSTVLDSTQLKHRSINTMSVLHKIDRIGSAKFGHKDALEHQIN